MKFHVISFGCQMNANDSDWLVRALESRGWTEAPEDQARVFIVNTCSVREKPEQKVYSLLGRLEQNARRDARVFAAVGGCVAQQVGRGFFERFSFVRLVFGTDAVALAPEALERLAQAPDQRLALLDFLPVYAEREDPAPRAGGPAQAFVNIMQGCDNFCAYCIVPYVRGRQKSRHPGAVLAECRALAERGVREITLLGQNVNSFGLDRGGAGVSFARLLRQVAAIPGVAPPKRSNPLVGRGRATSMLRTSAPATVPSGRGSAARSTTTPRSSPSTSTFSPQPAPHELR
jgi:tRNA-2-methylthio-N6-dimethylallyladenosine synthase